jgi:hypothetical protein
VSRTQPELRNAGEAASSRWLQLIARGGRGVNYVLVGLLALQIAFGSTGKQADSAGALHALVGQRGGIVVL